MNNQVTIRATYVLLILLLGFTPFLGSENNKFYALTLLLIVYNGVELLNIHRKKTEYFFISSILLGVGSTFMLLLGGIPNLLSIGENGIYMVKIYTPDVGYERHWLTLVMKLTCFSSLCTWVAYDSKVGNRLYNFISRNGIYKIIYNDEVAITRLVLLTIFAYGIKFYLYSIGLFGRSLDEQYFDAATGFKEGSQLRILGDLSYLTFFLICIQKFKTNLKVYNTLFIISLPLELIFGFIYGARSTIMVPLILVFFSYYYVNKKIRVSYLGIVALSIFLAFTIVLEFKNYSLSPDFEKSSNPIDVIHNFYTYKNRFASGNAVISSGDAAQIFVERVSAVPEAAMAIRYAEVHGMRNSRAPNIGQAMLQAPYDAFVPKFIQGENEFLWGIWFKDEVLHLNIGLKYSMAMSAVGFLYMGGGWILVIIGFLLYGIMLKTADLFLRNNNIFCLLVFVMLINVLINIEGSMNATIIYFIRYVVLYPIMLWLLLGKKSYLRLNPNS